VLRPSRTIFRGAAAISNKMTPSGDRVHQRRATDGRQSGLGLAVDDFQIEPDLLEHPGAESLPLAAERQASVAIRRARAAPRLSILSRQIDSASIAPLDRGLAEPARRPHAFAQRMMRGERIDHPKPSRAAGRPATGNYGAKIERRIGRRAVPMAGPPSGADGAGASADPTVAEFSAPSVHGSTGRSPGLVRPFIPSRRAEASRMLGRRGCDCSKDREKL